MKSPYLYILIAYISYIVGIGWGNIGKLPEIEPYSWHLPLDMFLFSIFPAYFGYMAGKETKRKE